MRYDHPPFVSTLIRHGSVKIYYANGPVAQHSVCLYGSTKLICSPIAYNINPALSMRLSSGSWILEIPAGFYEIEDLGFAYTEYNGQMRFGRRPGWPLTSSCRVYP